MQRLLRFALDDETDDNTALRAIIAALDRAGIVVPNTVDVTVGPRPWEEVFDSISGGPREASRAARGDNHAGDTHALEAPVASHEIEIIDAEPLEPESRDFKPEPITRRQRMSPPITGGDAIAEAGRINRALGVYDRKALAPRAVVKHVAAQHDSDRGRGYAARELHEECARRVEPHERSIPAGC